MTTAELIKNIGKVAKWHDDKGLTFDVTITDSRIRWGQVDYLIVPVAGYGSRWVADTSVTSIQTPCKYCDAMDSISFGQCISCGEQVED